MTPALHDHHCLTRVALGLIATLVLSACGHADTGPATTAAAADTDAAPAPAPTAAPLPVPKTTLVGTRLPGHNGRFIGQIGDHGLDVPVFCADMSAERGTATIHSEDSLRARNTDNNGDGIAISLQGFGHTLTVDVTLPDNRYTFLADKNLRITDTGVSYHNHLERGRDDGSRERYDAHFQVDCSGT